MELKLDESFTQPGLQSGRAVFLPGQTAAKLKGK